MKLRHWLWTIGASGLLVLGLNALLFSVYPYARWTEDFFPGTAPDTVLEPNAWEISEDSLTFAVLGDGGTGGRNALDIAQQMVETYEQTPYGVVIHVGDISYYGSAADRWDEVVDQPYGPLLDAGITFELAIGNHELEENPSAEADQAIVEKIEQIGTEGRYYTVTHGPVEFFILDSSTPHYTGVRTGEQLAWLEEVLAASSARWKVAVLHHPPYASGPKRGSDMEVREAVEPLFIEYGVDLVLTGHDHFYERSKPQEGVVYVVSGGGAKISDVGMSDFTAVSAKTLQFMLVQVEGDQMHLQSIDQHGDIVDDFTIAKEAS